MILSESDIDRIARRVVELLGDQLATKAAQRDIIARLERIETPIRNTIVRRKSVKQQAREAGVHPTTIWRRQRRERARQMAEEGLR